MNSIQIKELAYSLGADLCGINQGACWDYAFGEDKEKQDWRISCHICRDICPYNLGSKNRLFENGVSQCGGGE